MPDWTPDSLRPPRPEDAPFYAIDFGMVIAGDGVVHPMPKTTAHFDNVARSDPTLPLRDELERLCRTYNEEVLAALANALRATVVGMVRRGRPRRGSARSPAGTTSAFRLSPVTTQDFDNADRKYPALALHDELQGLCRTLPSTALAALADALRATVAGSTRRGRRRLQGMGGPPALVRAAVQARRRRGLSDNQIAREIEHLFPRGQSDEARRVRVRREVRKVPLSASTGVQVSHQLALAWWASFRAERQLVAAIRRGCLTEEEAAQRIEERKSRFMSFAQQGRLP